MELAGVLSNDTIRSIERTERELTERLSRSLGFDLKVHIGEPRSLSANGEKAPVVVDRRTV